MLWTTEIWDVRRDLARFKNKPVAQRPYGRLGGADCTLADTSRYCLACSHSQLDLSCRFRCSRVNGNVSFAAPHGIDRWQPAARRAIHARWERLFFGRGVNNVAHEMVLDAALRLLHNGENVSSAEVHKKVWERFSGR